MKPLLEMTAHNDDAMGPPRGTVTVERARKREGRDRRLKGPTWAVPQRDTKVA